MPQLRFPFRWGSVPATSASTVTASTDRWTKVTASADVWSKPSANVHRFERVYTQPALAFGQSVNFAFHVQSQFPHLISTQNPTLVVSTITSP